MPNRTEILQQAIAKENEFLYSWNDRVEKHMKKKHKGLPASGCHVCAMSSLSIISARSNIRDFRAELAELKEVGK